MDRTGEAPRNGTHSNGVHPEWLYTDEPRDAGAHEVGPLAGSQSGSVLRRIVPVDQVLVQRLHKRVGVRRGKALAEFRAQGSQKSQEIRARADRDVTVLLAEANSHSEQIRGEGDSTRNRIFADAYSRDPDFFAFYRSMQAYQDALGGNTTTMVLSPNSEFFRYFGQSPAGGGKKK